MITHEIKVRTLTPVWTGSADGTPDGLKISGVIGSMRMVFEALVRKAGGHTCDITGPANHRCIKNNDEAPICPACAIFGCTGLSRSFKIDWPLPRIGNIILPFADTRGELANRDHFGKTYPKGSQQKDTPIAKWLTKTISNDWRSKVQPAYSPDLSSIRVTQLRTVEINHQPVDVPKIIAGLLTFMAQKYGIGAKVDQGWGIFSVADDCQVKNVDLTAEIQALCNGRPFTDRWDQGMPNAEAFDRRPYTIQKTDGGLYFSIKKQKTGAYAERWVDNLGFEWQSNPLKDNFICLGYALKYRLRRMVKFAQTLAKTADTKDKAVYDAINDLAQEWATNNRDRVEKYGSKIIPWRDNGAFAQYLFGAAANEKNDQYGAGLFGVSHLYRTNNDDRWSVRLLIQCPDDEYNETINLLFFANIKEALES